MKLRAAHIVVAAMLGIGASVFFIPQVSSSPFGGSEPARCGPGLDCTSDTFTAADAAGVGFSCNSAVATCFDPGPGVNNGIGTDGVRLILGTGAGTAEVWIGEDNNITLTENGNLQIGNGALILNNSTAIYNQTPGKSVPVDAAFGLSITKKTLGTCAAAFESPTSIVSDAAAGGTTGNLTRLCMCASDGGGVPVYTWRNVGCPNTVGTNTTCPACP